MTKLRRVLAVLGMAVVHLVAAESIDRARHTRVWCEHWRRAGVELP